ncbi:MAG: NAD(P)H-dependent oxidoreductase subunit E [Gemmatales bacterium]|nr:NAD(P)H-dependent oxidoreductase subunit E [Gemmatales bacterium]MDW8387929.1 NAD(P)H-dependent oxidoreductase subunit E [Gemmatales bacterium]
MAVLTEAMREKIRAYLPRYPSKQAVVLPALHIVQDELRCVPLEAVREIAEMLDLHPAQVQDTLSFYGFFRDEQHPLGRKRVWVCRSLTCMLRGGEGLLRDLAARLGVHPGETTADGQVTLEFAECLGQCEGAPCLMIGDEVHGPITTEQALELLNRAEATP